VLVRVAYLSLTNTFAMLSLLPMSNPDKDLEILALRHQIGAVPSPVTSSLAMSPRYEGKPTVGYPFALLMAVVCVGLYSIFKRRGGCDSSSMAHLYMQLIRHFLSSRD
jgi:hypothetical protein